MTFTDRLKEATGLALMRKPLFCSKTDNEWKNNCLCAHNSYSDDCRFRSCEIPEPNIKCVYDKRNI